MHKVGLIKRLIVIIYDGLLLAGITLVAWVPMYGIEAALPAAIATSTLFAAFKILYLVLIPFLFYGWFWTHGGQTLGMRAWHLYLINSAGKFPDWRTSAIRYLSAGISWFGVAGLLYVAKLELWYLGIGLGFAWILLNPERLAWHDILSGTRIVRVPAKKPTQA